MKIIVPSSSQQWSIEHVCTGWGSNTRGCGARLLVELSDLNSIPNAIFPDKITVLAFTCPCCGVQTVLGLNDWPKTLTD